MNGLSLHNTWYNKSFNIHIWIYLKRGYELYNINKYYTSLQYLNMVFQKAILLLCKIVFFLNLVSARGVFLGSQFLPTVIASVVVKCVLYQ